MLIVENADRGIIQLTMRPYASFKFTERRQYDFLDKLSDEECYDRFRFNKDDLFALFEEIRESFGDVKCYRKSDITPFYQMLIFLRYYATGSFQEATSDLQQVSKPTVSRCIARISAAIAKLSVDYIKFPSEDELDDIKMEFYSIDSFPGIIGAIDCTHIPFQARGEENRERFINRKSISTINVQAVVDSNLNFINIVSRWPGSTHDTRIFDNSRLRMRLESGQITGGWLIGDSGLEVGTDTRSV